VITNVCQRWRAHRSHYRPAGEPIDTSRYEVSEIPDDTTAKDFIKTHHYDRSFPGAIARFGLHEHGGRLVGVAVYSEVRPNVLESARIMVPAIELARLVLLPSVPANGETYFVGETRRRLGHADRAEVILSHSDDFPRNTIDGRVTHVGHIGTIYQASNAAYAGRARRNPQYLLADGLVFSQAVQSKIRGRKRGWRYGVELLVERGADPPAPGEDLRGWLTRWRAELCRARRHPGNHRYLIPVTRRARRWLPESLPYPKLDGPVRLLDAFEWPAPQRHWEPQT
jgi:hypothetical protein